MKTICRRISIAGLSAVVLASAVTGAFAENAKVRLAYLFADSMLPMLYAQEKGYFKEAGIDLEATPVQGGPAAVAAVASGEADIGYSAFVPPINGRIAGIPLKLFLTLSHEKQPGHVFTFFVSSKASGISSVKDLAGKKVAINANGGLCDLALREHLAANGMTIDDVQLVVLPFPETEKSLEQGSIDASCTVPPFYSSIMTNANISAKVVASGMLADLSQPVVSDGVYALEEWIGKNTETATKFAKVMDKSRKELMADRALLEAQAIKQMELSPETAKTFELPILIPEMTIKGDDIQVVLDAMRRDGMISTTLNGADFVSTITY